MSKIFNKTKKISVSVLFFIALVSVIVTGMYASITDYKTTVVDLAKEAQKESWYNYSPTKELIGKKIGITASITYNSAYCIDGHTPKDNGNSWGGYYDIVNVFDVNNNDNSVVVYSKENPKGTKYSLSDKKIKPILMLSYLTQKATENSSDLNTFGYKDVLSRIFWNKTWISDLRKVGLSKSFHTPYNLDSTNLTYASQKIAEAKKYAENMMAQGAIETAELSDSVMTEAEKSKVSVTRINGKTFIGPYRINLKATKVGEIKVNGEKAVGISTDLKTVKSVDKVVDAKEFYVVTDKDYSEITSIVVKAKETISTMKSRMVLLGNSPSQNFLVWKSEETKVQPEANLETPKLGILEIQKVDQFKDSKVSLKDIEFKVYAEKKGWVSKDGEKIGFVEKYDDATSFKTDKNGKITIKNLPTGKYSIYETGLPSNLQELYQLEEIKVPGKDEKVKAKRVVQNKNVQNYTVSAGQTATVTAVNDRARTDVYVHKTDADTGKALNGYEFRLYRVDGDNQGWVKAENNTVLEKDMYTKDFNDPQVAKLLTENGKTQTLQGLPIGKYELYETKLGENSEAYELGTFSKDGQKGLPGKLVDTKEVKANETGIFSFEVKNRQVFIKISGKVFEDVVKQIKNERSRDGEYKEAEDRVIEGIEVFLVDRMTNQQISTFTNEKGEYSFDKVRIRSTSDSEKADYLNRYYVKFKYDGFIYQSTVSSQNEIKLFNDDGKTINDTTSKAIETDASREKLNNQFKQVTGKGLSDGKDIVKELKYNKSGDIVTLDNASKLVETNTGVKVEGETDFEIKATVLGKYLQAYYDKLKETQDVVTEIPHIDLGVYRREMTNLALTKYIHNAEVSVNDKTYTYDKYNDSEENVTMGAVFDSQFATLPIYKADVEYSNENKDKALHASVTYKIQLSNYSGSLYSTVNELKEWYSKHYSIATVNGKPAIYLSNNENGFSDNDRVEGVTVTTDTTDSTYTKSIIKFNQGIAIPPRISGEKNSKYLYIKFDIDDAGKIYNRDDIKLENYAEISNYTTYSDKEYKKLYAAIDESSIPETLDPKNFKETDEDDSDKARGLHLVEAAERTISGTVFEDGAITFGAGQERIGDGKYDEGAEATISDVEVNLLQKDKDGWKIVGTTKTEANGNFSFTGFAAGTYKVQYKWGNDKYKVENYKGTIFVNADRKDDPTWIIKEKEEDPRYSDAMDDYELRKAIDQKALFNRDIEGYSDLSKMISETPVFAIDIEKEHYETEPGENGYKFNVPHIDFGIIERPRQAMEISKKLKSILLTQNNGAQLVNASIKEDGTLDVKTGEKWVTGGKDYLWVQVDKSITGGLDAELGYNITVSNVSEIDYDDENYYKFGTKGDNIITMNLQAKLIYDYCKGGKLTSNDSKVWKLVGSPEEKETWTEANFKEQFENNSKKYDTVEDFTWEGSYSDIKDIYQDWAQQMASTRTTDVRKVKLENREIVEYVGDKLTQPLAPGKSATEEIIIAKQLANGQDIRFDNDAEITEIGFETNSSTGSKPSAYTSKLYTRAAWTTVTPATGEDRDYTWIIITAVSAIAVLGVGIIIIKKKVLK